MGGLGRIYFTAIDRYAARFNITSSDFDNLLTFVRALDDEYLRHMSEQRKVEEAKAKT